MPSKSFALLLGLAACAVGAGDGSVSVRGGSASQEDPHPWGASRERASSLADLAGDYRDEVVCLGTTKHGAQALFVYTGTEPIESRDVTRTASREYRLWLARNFGGGYRSYSAWEPEP